MTAWRNYYHPSWWMQGCHWWWQALHGGFCSVIMRVVLYLLRTQAKVLKGLRILLRGCYNWWLRAHPVPETNIPVLLIFYSWYLLQPERLVVRGKAFCWISLILGTNQKYPTWHWPHGCAHGAAVSHCGTADPQIIWAEHEVSFLCQVSLLAPLHLYRNPPKSPHREFFLSQG